MAHDIFISYSNHDTQAADAVCIALEAAHLRCWIAPRDVPPGQHYGEAIVESVSLSKILVLIFSAHTNHSDHVRAELEQAFEHKIPILPLRIEAAAISGSLKYFVGTRQWLDAFEPPLPQHFPAVIDAVERLLGAPVSAANDAGECPRARRPILKRMTRWRGLASVATIVLIALAYGPPAVQSCHRQDGRSASPLRGASGDSVRRDESAAGSAPGTELPLVIPNSNAHDAGTVASSAQDAPEEARRTSANVQGRNRDVPLADETGVPRSNPLATHTQVPPSASDSATIAVARTNWGEIRVDVRPQSLAYSIFIDGRPCLQSSGLATMAVRSGQAFDLRLVIDGYGGSVFLGRHTLGPEQMLEIGTIEIRAAILSIMCVDSFVALLDGRPVKMATPTQVDRVNVLPGSYELEIACPGHKVNRVNVYGTPTDLELLGAGSIGSRFRLDVIRDVEATLMVTVD